MFRDEPQLDLADASIYDLITYCVALTNMARGQSTSWYRPALRARVTVFRVSRNVPTK